jgi:hypothetical protein
VRCMRIEELGAARRCSNVTLIRGFVHGGGTQTESEPVGKHATSFWSESRVGKCLGLDNTCLCFLHRHPLSSAVQLKLLAPAPQQNGRWKTVVTASLGERVGRLRRPKIVVTRYPRWLRRN